MAKPKIPNQRKQNLEHKARIERYVALINQLYARLNNEAAKIAERTGHDDTSPFRWSDYPETKSALQKLQADYVKEMGAIVMSGTSNEWKESNIVQDLVAKKVLKAYTGTDKAGEEYKRYFESNPDALEAFRQRKENGMKLSDRVWNLSEQYKTELEDAISAAIEPGQSAMSLAVDIKQYLNEPDLMFRRFRYKDESGQWKKKWKRKITDEDGKTRFIDCDKGSYCNQWTGRGYYKSSAKNARRLARTEINMAYRTAEQARWEQFDFVVGYEVKTTQNGHHVTDICDDLKGKYPKSFKFTGWHPMCLCYCIPILKTEDEFWSDDDVKSVNEVTDVPKGFKDWVGKNAERIERAEKRGTVPYFIRDNKQVVTHILKGESTTTDNNASTATSKAVPVNEPSPLEKNHQELAKALGIEQGKPMTFEEANELRGNPHYSESVGYRVNCQSAVVANEMRRRGFDVEARANVSGSVPEKLSKNTAAAWVDVSGETPKKSRAGGWYFKSGSVKEYYKTPRQMMTEFDDLTAEPGRYHIDWKWKGRTNDGHIITFERLADGRGFYYDPQSGKRFDKFPWTAKVAPKFGIKVLRVDNLRLNVEMAKGVMAPAGTAKIAGKATPSVTSGWKGEIKADVAEYVKARNAAKTYREKVALDIDMIKNGEFVRSEYHSTSKGSIFATEELPKKIDSSSLELSKNIQMAKKMANNGYDVYLLSNPRSGKSADFIFSKGGKVYYTEGKLSTGKNSLGHNLAKGSSQSERILVDLTGTNDSNYITARLEEAFKNNSDLKEVMLLKGGRMIPIKELTVQRKDFKQYFKRVWEQKK